MATDVWLGTGSLRRAEGAPPLYLQIRDRVVAAIQDGALAAGAQAPSESDLVARFAVGRPTVRQAVALLRKEGWLTTRRGLGSFVAHRVPEVSLLGFDGLTQSLSARGLSVQDQVLTEATTEQLSLSMLDADGAGPWWTITRLRSVVLNGKPKPLCLETDCFPLELCPDAAAVFRRTGSATAVLEETYGLDVATFEVATRAVALAAQPAKVLGMQVASPALSMERLNRDAGGAVAHAVTFLLRTDEVPLVERLNNPPS